MSILGGFFYDKFGTVPTLLIGAFLLFAGYFVMWLTIWLQWSDSVLIMCACAAVMGQGGGWIYTVALNTNAANFRQEDHGKILGLLTCSFALCSGIFTQIYNGFFGDSDVQSFMLFLSIVLPSVALLLAVFLNVLPPHFHAYDSMVVGQRALIGYLLLAVLASYICASTFAQNFSSISATDMTFGLLVCVSSIILLPVGTGKWFWRADIEQSMLSESDEETPLVRPEEFSILIGHYTLPQCMRRVEFWMLFIIASCGIGTGVTVVNNLSDIVQSRESVEEFESYESSRLPHHKEIAALVALFSIFNATGRLSAGYFSDMLHSAHKSRAWLLLLASIIMGGAQLTLAWAGLDLLYMVVVLVGLSEGTFFAIVPTICLELFSIDNFGANWSFLTIGSAGLSVFLGSYVAGVLRLVPLPPIDCLFH